MHLRPVHRWLRLLSVRSIVGLLLNVLPIVMGGSVFVFVLLCITLCLSSFAIILKRKRESVVLILLSYECLAFENAL